MAYGEPKPQIVLILKRLVSRSFSERVFSFPSIPLQSFSTCLTLCKYVNVLHSFPFKLERRKLCEQSAHMSSGSNTFSMFSQPLLPGNFNLKIFLEQILWITFINSQYTYVVLCDLFMSLARSFYFLILKRLS